jgi:hypothetical protein
MCGTSGPEGGPLPGVTLALGGQAWEGRSVVLRKTATSVVWWCTSHMRADCQWPYGCWMMAGGQQQVRALCTCRAAAAACRHIT